MSLLTKKEIIRRITNIEALGMDCSFTREALKENKNITALNEAWEIDRRLIAGAINDISLYL